MRTSTAIRMLKDISREYSLCYFDRSYMIFNKDYDSPAAYYSENMGDLRECLKSTDKYKSIHNHIFHTSFFLAITINGGSIQITTKNRYGNELYRHNVKYYDDLKKIVSEQLTTIKQGKIKRKLEEMEQDFKPIDDTISPLPYFQLD